MKTNVIIVILALLFAGKSFGQNTPSAPAGWADALTYPTNYFGLGAVLSSGTTPQNYIKDYGPLSGCITRVQANAAGCKAGWFGFYGDGGTNTINLTNVSKTGAMVVYYGTNYSHSGPADSTKLTQVACALIKSVSDGGTGNGSATFQSVSGRRYFLEIIGFNGSFSYGGSLKTNLPVVYSTTPSVLTPGQTAVLTGDNFTGTTALSFNGVQATNFTVVSNTEIAATVPTGATSGPLQLTVAAGTTTSEISAPISNPIPPTASLLTAESGNTAADVANCWAFGTFTPIATNVISGSYSYIGNNANTTLLSDCYIRSPWYKFSSGTVITLKGKVDVNSGTMRKLVFSYCVYDANQPAGQGPWIRFDSITYTILPTSAQNMTINIPSAIVSNTNMYKILISGMGSGGSARWILDDLNFSNASYWSNPSNSCLPMQVNIDSDADGVQDANDAYPNDPSRAYNNYFPASGYNTLMFEDLWPSLGDYDFNDLVLGYRTNKVTNAANKLVEIKATYIIRAIGASKTNGFGIQLNNISPSKVLEVTGTKTNNASWLSVAANGTENGQTYANIIVYDNVNRLMPNQGGSGINTIPGTPYVTPDTANITISFTTVPGQAISASAVTLNPFLIIDQDRGKEVHLPDFVPTTKASASFFGQSQDNTNPGAGVYYKSKVNNLPWALDVPENIPYMIEREDVITGFLKLVNWAQSNGASYNNWHENQSGYRNPVKLYNH